MKPYYQTDLGKLYLGDCLEIMPALDQKFDLCLTDPPYGLSFMGKKWDYDVPSIKIWSQCLRVLKPGAHALIFAGSRTQHRMAVNIEDAGFIIKDCLMWMYGSGFPKSTDISKQLDKMAGKERTEGAREWKGGLRHSNKLGGGGGKESGTTSLIKYDTPATPEAQLWNGWGTHTKPAYEPLICAQKPLDFSTQYRIIVENLLKKETQLWLILHARLVEITSESSQAMQRELNTAQWTVSQLTNTLENLSGRMDMRRLKSAVTSCLSTVSSWRKSLEELWRDTSTSTIKTEINRIIDWRTLNCLLSDSTPQDIILAEIKQPGLRLNALPAGKILNAAEKSMAAIQGLSVAENVMSNYLGSSQDVAGKTLFPNHEPILLAMKPNEGTYAQNALKHGVAGINIDAARIGYADNETPESVNKSSGISGGVFGTNKPTKIETKGRFPANIILDEEAAALLDQQSGISQSRVGARGGTSPNPMSWKDGRKDGQDLHGHQDQGGASRFFYCAKASKSDRGKDNNHPTVKPVKLIEYLLTLLSYPGDIVTLDPFGGSCTTAVACENLNRRWVLIEKEEKYCEISAKRIEEVTAQMRF